MLTGALERILFVFAFMWPITLPLFLMLLGCLIYLAVYAVKNWDKRSVRIGAGVAAVCVLLFGSVLGREGQPYSETAAQRLYESHQNAYDTVAAYLLAEGGVYQTSSREAWPEEIAAELNEVLTIWSLRCGSPNVSTHDLNGGDCAAVLFHIYSGPEYDSGDGGSAYDSQYLAYAPEGSHLHISNSYLERLTHLTGDWYLYRIVNV